MKKAIILAATLLISQRSLALEVFACEQEWGALAQTLGGDKVSVYVATTAMQDIHTIDARPSLIAKLRRADLVVCSGADLEVGWLPQLQRQAGNSRVQSGNGVLFAADTVSLLEKPGALDRAQGDVHPQGNPHVQFDPHRMLTVATALSARLVALDGANADGYRKNFASFKDSWEKAIARWEAAAAPLKGRNVVVQHSTFTYLLNWLGMNAVAMMEPKPGLPPTTAHLQEVLQIIKAQPVMAVMNATYQDARPSEWLSERAGIPMVSLPQSIGGDDKSTDLIAWYDNVIGLLLKVAK
ncbi:zinc ABC transporter solute-binding protein [Permianibacter sp. IMCC34836]|nr:zinc ABC transporter solute-binding protein [Permianibacter fluminis]